jgi:hypothetical protein
MGVKGLHSYMETRMPLARHKVALRELASSLPGGRGTIVVDGMALIRRMYTLDLEWIVGGQFQDLWVNVAQFTAAFEACGLRLVVFFDGGVDDAKLSEWQTRRLNDMKKVERCAPPPPRARGRRRRAHRRERRVSASGALVAARLDTVRACACPWRSVVESLAKGEAPAKATWMPPPNISRAVGAAFADVGCEVHYTAGEADREIARYCVHRRCAAVLAKDSDFFILPVPAYLVL